MIEIMGEFGFDVVLIQNQKAGRDYYDTAWTLSILRGVATGVVMILIAGSAAEFFGDARLTEIIYVLALLAVVAGFINIGTVDFRKEMTFGKDFRFLVSNKLIAFVITLTLAFTLRSYWALVIGIACGGTAKTILSYVMHSTLYLRDDDLGYLGDVLGTGRKFFVCFINFLLFFINFSKNKNF